MSGVEISRPQGCVIRLARKRKAIPAGGPAPAVDVIIAALFPVTWVWPDLIYAGMFEMLATYLAAELIVLLALFTLAKGHLADTREQLYFDWKLVRWVVLIVAAYFVLESGLDWPTLVFLAVALASADFPLRIAAHENWQQQLDKDVWILLGICLLAVLLSAGTAHMATPEVRIPAEGIIRDLFLNDPRLPQEILSMGTFYFIAKAVLNGYRFMTDPEAGVTAT